jgi:hypothetical protein
MLKLCVCLSVCPFTTNQHVSTPKLTQWNVLLRSLHPNLILICTYQIQTKLQEMQRVKDKTGRGYIKCKNEQKETVGDSYVKVGAYAWKRLKEEDVSNTTPILHSRQTELYKNQHTQPYVCVCVHMHVWICRHVCVRAHVWGVCLSVSDCFVHIHEYT